MSETEKQEGQKTVVAFIAGLLIGGLLVWVFSAPQEPTGESTETDTEVSESEDASQIKLPTENSTDNQDKGGPAVATLPTGNGALEVADQSGGAVVTLSSAEYPTAEGWVAVRDYDGENVGGILGAARYSQSQGLIPQEVELLRGTESGTTYAVVFFTEDGSVNDEGGLYFDPAGDQQIDGILTTFTAQ